MPKPGDIYHLPAEVYRLGRSQHGHFCIVIGMDKKGVQVNLLSSSMDLYDASEHFMLDENHEDFDATKLDHSTYAVRVSPIIPLYQLEGKGSPRGVLQGDLRKRFEEWWGESI
ncbi:MAG: hypothetical protein HY291_04780 [Planctomycetes bacterium]|nr:hypothetical protein [Planctomycetota bacterium]